MNYSNDLENGLSIELNVNEVFISSLLKEGLQTGFYELINKYRVEEAIRMIENGNLKHITVDALAKEAGFKSKSTFKSLFNDTNSILYAVNVSNFSNRFGS